MTALRKTHYRAARTRAWTALRVMALWGLALPALAEEPLVRDFQDRDPMAYGRRLYSEGKLDAAMREFELAEKEDPESLIPLRFKARIYAQQKEYAEAVDRLHLLQQNGVSILLAPDCRATLGVVLRGIGTTEDLATRAELLIHLRETLLGLPAEFLWSIEAHLIGIYAKTDAVRLYKAAVERYFRNRKATPRLFGVLSRALMVYEVKLRDAATYAEQALELVAAEREKLTTTNDPDRDRTLRELFDAQLAGQRVLLAQAYDRAGLRDADRNQLMAAEGQAAVQFTDVTDSSGLKDATPGGIAVGDYDGDGFQDIVVAGRLFRNSKGSAFLDVTETAGLPSARVPFALWFDADRDGDLDLLLGSMPKLALWQNRGDGTFADVTEAAGLGKELSGVPTALAATDFDGDGVVDLFVGCMGLGDRDAAPGQDRLFRGRGTRFEDVTERSGLAKAPPRFTRGAAWADADDDGDLDLLATHDRGGGNRLWLNQGKGAFVDAAKALGLRGKPGRGRYVLSYGASAGCAWGDVNGDGSVDLVVAHRAYYRQPYSPRTVSVYLATEGKAGRIYTDSIRTAGIAYVDRVSHASLCDFDNDGDLDLLLGSAYPGHPTLLYQNTGKGAFEAVTWRAGLVVFDSRSHVWLDKDNDGDLDVIVAGRGGCRVFENPVADTAWLRVRLVGKLSNRFGIGSRVTVTAGERQFVRRMTAGTGTGAQASCIAHFGLGAHTGPVRVNVRWPDGNAQVRDGVAPRTLVALDEE
ncbi:CRTAC1 family protein [bacterium]|nr:CRTAC1 family protein [bacterium]